jgi:hypothetical protein
MADWIHPLTLAFDVVGKKLHLNKRMKARIEQAGFTEVEEEVHEWPIGPWPADPHDQAVGEAARMHFDSGPEGWTLRPLTHVCGWSPDQVQSFSAAMRTDLYRQDLHALQEMRIVVGRKPERELLSPREVARPATSQDPCSERPPKRRRTDLIPVTKQVKPAEQIARSRRVKMTDNHRWGESKDENEEIGNNTGAPVAATTTANRVCHECEVAVVKRS